MNDEERWEAAFQCALMTAVLAGFFAALFGFMAYQNASMRDSGTPVTATVTDIRDGRYAPMTNEPDRWATVVFDEPPLGSAEIKANDAYFSGVQVGDEVPLLVPSSGNVSEAWHRDRVLRNTYVAWVFQAMVVIVAICAAVVAASLWVRRDPKEAAVSAQPATAGLSNDAPELPSPELRAYLARDRPRLASSTSGTFDSYRPRAPALRPALYTRAGLARQPLERYTLPQHSIPELAQVDWSRRRLSRGEAKSLAFWKWAARNDPDWFEANKTPPKGPQGC